MSSAGEIREPEKLLFSARQEIRTRAGVPFIPNNVLQINARYDYEVRDRFDNQMATATGEQVKLIIQHKPDQVFSQSVRIIEKKIYALP